MTGDAIAVERIVSVVSTYADLQGALKERRRALGMTVSELDYISGVQSGYSTKLENGIRSYGPASLGAILGALGLQIVLVRAGSSQGTEMPMDWEQSYRAQKEIRKKRAQKGGRRRWGEFLPEERSEAMRRLAMKRHRKGKIAVSARRKSAKRAAGLPVEIEGGGCDQPGDCEPVAGSDGF